MNDEELGGALREYLKEIKEEVGLLDGQFMTLAPMGKYSKGANPPAQRLENMRQFAIPKDVFDEC
jgi:hypothetical protein